MRLIDAEALAASFMQSFRACGTWAETHCDADLTARASATAATFLDCYIRTKEAHAIDAVPVVRCRECAYYDGTGACTAQARAVFADGYCNNGTRWDA